MPRLSKEGFAQTRKAIFVKNFRSSRVSDLKASLKLVSD